MGYKFICGIKVPTCDRCHKISSVSPCIDCFEEMLDCIDEADRNLKNRDIENFSKNLNEIKSFFHEEDA